MSRTIVTTALLTIGAGLAIGFLPALSPVDRAAAGPGWQPTATLDTTQVESRGPLPGCVTPLGDRALGCDDGTVMSPIDEALIGPDGATHDDCWAVLWADHGEDEDAVAICADGYTEQP